MIGKYPCMYMCIHTNQRATYTRLDNTQEENMPQKLRNSRVNKNAKKSKRHFTSEVTKTELKYPVGNHSKFKMEYRHPNNFQLLIPSELATNKQLCTQNSLPCLYLYFGATLKAGVLNSRDSKQNELHGTI